MRELGKHSINQHKLISKIINKTKINQVYGGGKYIKKRVDGWEQNKKAKILNNKLDIFELINKGINNNDYLMIKWSTSIALNKITTNLKQSISHAVLSVS